MPSRKKETPATTTRSPDSRPPVTLMLLPAMVPNCTVLGATVMTVGVFLGSLFWWIALTAVVSAVRQRISPDVMLWLSRGAGGLIVAFGVVALVLALS